MITETIAESLVLALICWFCGGIFLVIAVATSRSKRAVSFYAQLPVAEKRINNISAYNRENAVLWAAYSIPYFLLGTLSLIADTGIVGIFLVVFCVGSIPALILAYQRIYRRYTT